MKEQLIIQTHDTGIESPVSISLTGPLCSIDALKLKSRIAQLMEGQHKDLRLDLTQVNDIDLKGINCLAFIFKMQRQKGCDVEFINPADSALMTVIRPTKMHMILPFSNSDLQIAS